MAESDLEEGELSQSAIKKSIEGSIGEGIAGIGAVALCIIGLANVLPTILLAVATIAAGVALAFDGGSIAARYAALMEDYDSSEGTVAQWGGMTTEFLAGAAGIALGILALLGVAPMVLIPIAALVFGTALILDSGLNARLSSLESQKARKTGINQRVVRETAEESASIQVLMGLGVVTLGILSLIGIDTVVLSLVGILGVGAAILLSGALIGGRMAHAYRHH